MEIPRHWGLNIQRYRLEGLARRNCGQIEFAAAPGISDCTLLPAWTSGRKVQGVSIATSLISIK